MIAKCTAETRSATSNVPILEIAILPPQYSTEYVQSVKV